MNAGLSNLATLVAHVCPSTWTVAADVSSALQSVLLAVGRGVAAQIEEYCGRKFVRTADDTFETTADQRVIQLPRFPVEGTPVVAVKGAGEAAFTTDSGAVDNIAPSSGVLYLGSQLGTYRDRVRVTYTGGYYFDTTEDGSGSQPAGSTAIPASLQLAWLLQCQHIVSARELLAQRALPADSGAQNAGATIDLLPAVKAALKPFQILAA